MRSPQSHYAPRAGEKPSWSDAGWLPYYAVRGLMELARARLAFTRFNASDILRFNARAKARQEASGPEHDAKLARIAYVIPRISGRLPWRSDCLIQAMAAQNWLKSAGHASEIQIGVERPEGGDFGAHAWLVCGDVIVTGGKIDQYHPLLTETELKQNKTANPPDDRLQ